MDLHQRNGNTGQSVDVGADRRFIDPHRVPRIGTDEWWTTRAPGMLGVVERILIAVALAAAALVVAAWIQRRQRADAPVRTGFAVPAQLDRSDFSRPEAPWLVAVFTSATCDTCRGVWDRAQPLESAAVVVQELEFGADRALHERYAIEAVPTTVVVDRAGVVAASFLGPVTATDLWAAVAEAREPGSTPGGCE